MKNKEFSVYRLFGLDLTSRKFYRRMLAMKQSALNCLETEMKEMDDTYAKRIAEATGRLQVAENALKAAIEDYNKLREACETTDADYAKLVEEHRQLESAYAQAKRELAKYHSKRGKNGRFVKRDNPQ